MASLIRKVISTAKAPGAIGPYSQAVLVDRTIYISGQLGMDPSSGQLVPGGVAEEAKQALTNMGEILKAAGCDFNNVVKTTVLLADINDFNTVNEVYKQYFKSSFPARAAYQVAALPKSHTERERGAETQAEGEAGSMHREPDVGLDPGSPGSRPRPKAGAKPLRHPGTPKYILFK
uniref:2-iminobutanoate/2-iminopropanoate deaminase isoform X1 n=1 Tax=Nyctereutes procyonoides TaxID=34880 RepID=UPI0024451147|nr:2-iminobutanoate/2-iminopropanoate deaminase isoform X1 [Nyctereutes procyonoides]